MKNDSLIPSGMYGFPLPISFKLASKSISRKGRNAIFKPRRSHYKNRTSFTTYYNDKSRTGCSSISFWRNWHTGTIDSTICRHWSNYILWQWTWWQQKGPGSGELWNDNTNPMKKALLGLYAFTGNKYTSAFFKKRKEKMMFHAAKISSVYGRYDETWLWLGNKWAYNSPACRISLQFVWTEESPLCEHSKITYILREV